MQSMNRSEGEYFYRPHEGHGLPHDPFKAIVAPRVIGWISTLDVNGRANLAPYSFFGAFASDPYVIGFSSEGEKDTFRNVRETGEFVWNLTSQDLAGRMNVTSTPAAHGVDEFELAGLTAVPGHAVSAPHVGESPAALECRLLQAVQLRALNGSRIRNWLVLGQVVGVIIRKEFLRNGLFDTFLARPVLRAGYRGDYAGIGERLVMNVPR